MSVTNAIELSNRYLLIGSNWTHHNYVAIRKHRTRDPAVRTFCLDHCFYISVKSHVFRYVRCKHLYSLPTSKSQ